MILEYTHIITILFIYQQEKIIWPENTMRVATKLKYISNNQMYCIIEELPIVTILILI